MASASCAPEGANSIYYSIASNTTFVTCLRVAQMYSYGGLVRRGPIVTSSRSRTPLVRQVY